MHIVFWARLWAVDRPPGSLLTLSRKAEGVVGTAEMFHDEAANGKIVLPKVTMVSL